MYEIEHEGTKDGILTLVVKDGETIGQRFLDWEVVFKMLNPTSFLLKESQNMGKWCFLNPQRKDESDEDYIMRYANEYSRFKNLVWIPNELQRQGNEK